MTEFTYGTDVEKQSRARSSNDIESDIRRTRERLGDDIEAIGDKLSPSHIKERAKQAVQRKSRSVFRTARENPLPSALIALGVAWLMKSKRNGEDHFNGGSTQGVKDKAQEVVSAAGEKVEHVAHDAAEKARRTGMTLQRFFETNPLIAGAGTLVLGAAVGALLPRTEKENHLMGRKRDELVNQAKSVAQHTQDAMEQRLEGGSSGSSQQRR